MTNGMPDMSLYHYTDSKGLIGILVDKAIWASGHRYLNDTAELTHALSVVQKQLAEHFRQASGSQQERYSLLQNWTSICDQHQFFVASFSQEKNKLSQWRAYCSHGGGFSIGFARELIDRRAKAQGFRLEKCEYNLKKQNELCEKIITEGYRAASQIDNMQQERNKDLKMVAEFGIPLLSVTPVLKNECFEEEREWRLVLHHLSTQNAERIHFRPGRYSPIPYVNFELVEKKGEPLEIEEIVIGPNLDISAAISSVKLLLKSVGVNCKITPYSGSYKNW
jgi:hypothetical protein